MPPEEFEEIDVTELTNKIDALEAENKALKERVNEIESWIEQFTKNQEEE